MGNIIHWENPNEKQVEQELQNLDDIGIRFEPNDHWTNKHYPCEDVGAIAGLVSVFYFYAACGIVFGAACGIAYLLRKLGAQ